MAPFPFTMAFQPIVDVRDRTIVAHEALARGPGGEGAGWVLAHVTAATLHAFDRAAPVRAIEIAARLGMPGRLSINVWPHAVQDLRSWVAAIREATDRTGFDPARLTFELVGTADAAGNRQLKRLVREYRRQAFKVALDDFATGSSCLLNLADLEPDLIKLDRRLVRACDQDHKRLAIISQLAELGLRLGTAVVGEGVERQEEAQALASVGVRLMQGYLFSRPLFEDYCDPRYIFDEPPPGQGTKRVAKD